MSDLPAPLVSSEIDLRSLTYMPLQIDRLKGSKAWKVCRRRPELAFYLLNLWMDAWQQHPVGSLEDDDDMLSAAADAHPRDWDAIREDVLRGWVKCSDGRLYHPVLAELAGEAWVKMSGNFRRTAAARSALEEKNRAKALAAASGHAVEDAVTGSVTETVTGFVTASVTGAEDMKIEDITPSDANASDPPLFPANDPSPAVSPQRLGTRLPADWALPDGWHAWAIAEGMPPPEVGRQADRFRDYWRGRAGKDGRKADWAATWRNWIRRAMEDRNGRTGNQRQHQHQQRGGFAAVAARMLDEGA